MISRDPTPSEKSHYFHEFLSAFLGKTSNAGTSAVAATTILMDIHVSRVFWIRRTSRDDETPWKIDELRLLLTNARSCYRANLPYACVSGQLSPSSSTNGQNSSGTIVTSNYRIVMNFPSRATVALLPF